MLIEHPKKKTDGCSLKTSTPQAAGATSSAPSPEEEPDATAAGDGNEGGFFCRFSRLICHDLPIENNDSPSFDLEIGQSDIESWSTAGSPSPTQPDHLPNTCFARFLSFPFSDM